MTTKAKSPKSSARNLAKTSVIESQRKPPNSFSIINELTCKNLLDSHNLGDIEDILTTNFKIDSPELNLKSAIIIDFYVNLVIWLKETFQLDAAKFSLIFSAIHYLLENIRTSQMSLKENVLELKTILTNDSENPGNPCKGLLSTLDGNELKKVNQFLLTGIIQHHKLMEFVFSYHRAQKVLGLDLFVETLPSDSTPYPPPLCEALTTDLYRNCFSSVGSVRSHSAKSVDNADFGQLEKDLDKFDKELSREISQFSDLSIDTISRVLKEECVNIFPPITAEIETKIQEIETNFFKKFNKSIK